MHARLDFENEFETFTIIYTVCLTNPYQLNIHTSYLQLVGFSILMVIQTL